MGWAYGIDSNGREVGYSVEAECDHPECHEQIDRGLSYKCELTGKYADFGCGNFFCEKHRVGGLCDACWKEYEPDEEENEEPSHG